MTDFEKQEFWNGLTRLYDSTLELRQSTQELRHSIADLYKIAELHQRELEAHREIAVAHEKRLDRNEVIMEWLAEQERKRNGKT